MAWCSEGTLLQAKWLHCILVVLAPCSAGYLAVPPASLLVNPPTPTTSQGGEVEVIWGEKNKPVELPVQLRRNDLVNTILWFKDSTGIPFYSVDSRGVPLHAARHLTNSDDLGVRSFFVAGSPPRLKLDKVTQADQGIFRVRVDYQNSPTVNYRINLTLTKPAEVTIRDEEGIELGTQAGPYNEQEVISLTCFVNGGVPRPVVSWWLDDVLVDSQAGSSAGSVVVRRLQLRAQRDLQASRLECRASQGRHALSSHSIYLNINLRPVSVKIVSAQGESLAAGKSKQLQCESYGSSPPANLTWLIDSQSIKHAATMSYVSMGGNKTTSTLSLRPQFEDDGRELSCTVRNNYFPGFEIRDSIYLRIAYSPIASVRLEPPLGGAGLKQGDNVSLICDIRANPPADYILWYHDGQLISKNETGAILSLEMLNPSSAGLYSCYARNSQGAGRSPPHAIRINYAPVCREGWAWREMGALVGRELEAECRVEAEPAHDLRFSWTLSRATEVVLMSPSKVETKGTTSRLLHRPSDKDLLAVLSCYATNSVGQQTAPCLVQLTPAKAPERPTDCQVQNRSGEGAEVHCEPGEDGGLSQHFVAEVRLKPKGGFLGGGQADEPQPGLLYTQNRPQPTFRLGGLAPATSYLVSVYAKNSAGQSSPHVEVHLDTTEPGPQQVLSTTESKVGEEVKKYMWWWTGGIVGLVSVLSAITVAVWTRGKPRMVDLPLNNVAPLVRQTPLPPSPRHHR